VSEWKTFKADGPAISWDKNGKIVNQGEFKDGDLLLQQDSVKYQ
jgi:antitoxin component YwqK of YwqJK toxin-antitoxin module